MVTDIIGLEDAVKQKGVHELHLDVQVGEMLAKAQDDRSRCGFYIIYADSVEELNIREKLLKETVKVVTR